MVASYDLSGYLVTPGVLSPEEIERYGAAVDAEVGVRTQKDKRSVAEKSLYEQSFIQCMRLWETSEEASRWSARGYHLKTSPYKMALWPTYRALIRQVD